MGANGRRDFPRYAAGLTVQLIVGSAEIKTRKPDHSRLVGDCLVIFPLRSITGSGGKLTGNALHAIFRESDGTHEERLIFVLNAIVATELAAAPPLPAILHRGGR